jgi:uncharacterized membrane protein
MSVLERNNVNLKQYKSLWIVVTAVLALLVASPALARVLVYPQTSFFTEVWLLGPGHMAEDYPYNITANENYRVFLDIANHLGSCAYYVVKVKFRNDTQSAPNSLNFTPSDLPSLYNMTAFVANGETWELPITFEFSYKVTTIQVNFKSMTFNGININLTGESSDWNPQNRAFYGNLLFELWIYNSTTSTFQYHERFVSLLLNMTA